MEGQELRVHQKVWKDLAMSEERLRLMKELLKINVGFKEIEEFNLDLLDKLRTERVRAGAEKITRKLIQSAMLIKIRDEEGYMEEMKIEKDKRRREINDKMRSPEQGS